MSKRARTSATSDVLADDIRKSINELVTKATCANDELRDFLQGGSELYTSLLASASEVLVLETEFADGDARLDWAALTRDKLARHGEQLLVAVVAVAACNVVHGDVKPGNIVLHTGAVRLIDFGLAVAVDQRAGSSARVRAAGTRGFMAPEVEETARRG